MYASLLIHCNLYIEKNLVKYFLHHNESLIVELSSIRFNNLCKLYFQLHTYFINKKQQQILVSHYDNVLSQTTYRWNACVSFPKYSMSHKILQVL